MSIGTELGSMFREHRIQKKKILNIQWGFEVTLNLPNPPLGTPVLLTNERAYNLGAANNFHISAFYLVLHFRSSIPPEWRRGFTRSSVTLLYLVSVVWYYNGAITASEGLHAFL